MSQRTTLSAALAAVAAVLAGPAAAQEAGSRQTRDFVQAASEADAFEIAAAEAALAQSGDAQVRSFATRMVEDHSRTSSALTAAATRAGLKPPVMAVGASQAPFLAALQSARGAEFDRLYWRQQALAHHAALAVERGYAASGDAPGIRDAAAAAVPVIEAHLAVAERMSRQADGS